MAALHDFGARVSTARDLFHPVMLHADFAKIAEARDAVSIEAAVQEFVRATGFDRYAVVIMDDDFSSTDSGVATHWIDNTPAEFEGEWSDPSLTKTDPVLVHCKSSGEPAAYGQEVYVRRGLGARWESQAASGFAYGIAVPFHLPHHQHVLFGVDRFAPLPESRGELTALVAYTQLFATYVQTAVQIVFGDGVPGDPPRTRGVHLSPREHECLQWAAEGKTAWETGMILSIAEGSVVKILASAIRKLDCANKPQAVVKALRLGLIR